MTIVALCLAAAAWADPGAVPYPVEDAVREALAANPELLAARRGAEAAAAAAWGAYSPGEVMVEPGRERDAGMASRNLTLRLELPFPGVSLLAGRAASALAGAARERARARALDVEARTRSAHARLWQADVTVEALGATRALMDQTAAIAQARVAGGRAGTEELLLAQAEAARMGIMLRMEQSERTQAEAELAGLLHRTGGTFGPVAAPPLEEPALDADALRARSRTAGPEPAMAAQEARAAGATAAAAALNVLPRLAPVYEVKRYDDGSRGTMVGLGLAYPLFVWAPATDALASRRAAQAARATAEAAADAGERQAAAETAETRSHLFAAREYRDVVLPLLTQAVQAARASYESGRGDILKLLAAARDELAARQAYAAEVQAFTAHRARLEQAVGGPLAAAR